jgi:pyridoxamine 5'-phosphate oxidase-like protein
MASGIDLTGEVGERVDSALADRRALAVSYVDAGGRPHLSLRGSVHVHGPDQLALWVRHAEGGLAAAVRANPALALLYRDADSRTTYVFSGRARIADDGDTRDTVFRASPQAEQDHDPERLGVAVLVDLDSVTGGTVGGSQVSMSRA